MKNFFVFFTILLSANFNTYSQNSIKSTPKEKIPYLWVVLQSNHNPIILSSPPYISSKDVMSMKLLNPLEFSKRYNIKNRQGIEAILKPEVQLYDSETFFKIYKINKVHRTYTIYSAQSKIVNLKEFFITKTYIKSIKIDIEKKRIDIDFNP